MNLKVAEFESTESGGLRLLGHKFLLLGQEGMQESLREAALQKALGEVLGELSTRARDVNVCAPGFHTFSKFVKLPPVDTSKVTQIIQYEAQQNVPFPLEEVVWDYQILGAAPTGELEVLLVAIKSDVVEGIFRSSENAGLRLQIVDVSPAALCNAFRYNYGDLQGCTMLLDIGAKTSNLLFFDKGNVYSRGINIGANAITQDFAKESKLKPEEADQIKIAEGFVSLGGAYEEPDNPNQAAISKIARQVMTRLHIQVNQTIQFYRNQQGGAAPERVFLAGGASIMPYTAQFFAEKLSLPVEYFNPFRNVEIAENVNREELAKVAHAMGEVVGLGLRNLAHCPVDLNLMPKSSLKRRALKQKQPYFIAAVFCLISVLFAYGYFYGRVAEKKQKALDDINQRIQPLASSQAELNGALGEMRKSRDVVDQYAAWMDDRVYWMRIFSKLREVFKAVEDKKDKELSAATGLWIEKFEPSAPDKPGEGANPDAAAPSAPRRGRRGQQAQASAPVSADVTAVTLTCRGINMRRSGADANTGIAAALQEELQAQTNYFVPSGTGVNGNLIGGGEADTTFSFQLTLKLKHPLD